MISAMLWIIIIGAIIGAIVSGIRALPDMIREENFRKQKEKEYLDSIEQWKEWDMDMYRRLADLNYFKHENYYSRLPEYRPK